MNESKFDSAYRSLTVQAKKVYDCVPISESFDAAQIIGELHRRNISMSDKHVILGCMNSLIDIGLVKEVSRGVFIREVIRKKIELKEHEVKQIEIEKDVKVKQQTPVTNTPAVVSPLDLLGDFANRLRTLADDAERIAMIIAGQAEKNDAETAKLRQLQAILKSLG